MAGVAAEIGAKALAPEVEALGAKVAPRLEAEGAKIAARLRRSWGSSAQKHLEAARTGLASRVGDRAASELLARSGEGAAAAADQLGRDLKARVARKPAGPSRVGGGAAGEAEGEAEDETEIEGGAESWAEAESGVGGGTEGKAWGGAEVHVRHPRPLAESLQIALLVVLAVVIVAAVVAVAVRGPDPLAAFGYGLLLGAATGAIALRIVAPCRDRPRAP